VGRHPDDGEPVLANFGRFGPYVKHGSEFRSLESDEQVFTVSLDQAVDLLRQPKRSRRRQSAPKAVLRELGTPAGGSAAVRVLDGRYGPYVTDGTTNASLPRGADVASFTLEAAAELLREKAATGPARKRPARGGFTRRKRQGA
jgi:DNA topoisomerase-1